MVSMIVRHEGYLGNLLCQTERAPCVHLKINISYVILKQMHEQLVITYRVCRQTYWRWQRIMQPKNCKLETAETKRCGKVGTKRLLQAKHVRKQKAVQFSGSGGVMVVDVDEKRKWT
jgi:hypothetical protein